jgi:hypothetical protein
MTDTLFLTVLHGGLIPEQTAQDNISDILVKKKKKMKSSAYLIYAEKCQVLSSAMYYFSLNQEFPMLCVQKIYKECQQLSVLLFQCLATNRTRDKAPSRRQNLDF